ncbi:phosphopyruvate hydratase [[Eubacterium] cellulosolvens]
MSPELTIENFQARRVFDSRGSETIEIGIFTKKGFGRFSSPSGASTGRWEVQAYPKKGIEESFEILNSEIKSKLIGMSTEDQKGIDDVLHEIDGTENFSRIGGNVALAISVSSALAAASSKKIPLFQQLSSTNKTALPRPLGNVIGGGLHAKGDKTDIQEFLVLPLKARTITEAALANIGIHRELSRILEKEKVSFGGKGDEGAWIAGLETIKALEVIDNACKKVEGNSDVKMGIGLDVAASTIWNKEDNLYDYEKDGRKLNTGEQIEFILSLIKEYNLVYVEDPLHEDDFESFGELTKKANKVLICGDDLFTTNIQRLELGLKHHAGNAIIIKPNQVGTLSDTFKTAKEAESYGYVTITSHRSGETCEPIISHLALALNSLIIKCGVLGGERVSKVNELIRIEEILGEKARLADIKL